MRWLTSLLMERRKDSERERERETKEKEKGKKRNAHSNLIWIQLGPFFILVSPIKSLSSVGIWNNFFYSVMHGNRGLAGKLQICLLPISFQCPSNIVSTGFLMSKFTEYVRSLKSLLQSPDWGCCTVQLSPCFLLNTNETQSLVSPPNKVHLYTLLLLFWARHYAYHCLGLGDLGKFNSAPFPAFSLIFLIQVTCLVPNTISFVTSLVEYQ